MKAKTFDIETACLKAYNSGKGGNVQAAIKIAEKHGFNTYRHCSSCEATMPVVTKRRIISNISIEVSSCLICGSLIKS